MQGSRYSNNNGDITFGRRVRLLGIAFKVYMHTVEGKLKTVNIAEIPDIKAWSKMPNDLGLVVRSDKILDFEPILEKVIEKENK